MVIIGILASVSIPKISAVHNDAIGLSDVLDERAKMIDEAREENHKYR